MIEVVASTITLSLGTVMDRTVIRMVADQEEFLMLIVKRNPMAWQMVRQLAEEFGVQAVTGMAFDFKRSVAESKLCVYPDASATGVYVRVNDFISNPLLQDILGK